MKLRACPICKTDMYVYSYPSPVGGDKITCGCNVCGASVGPCETEEEAERKWNKLVGYKHSFPPLVAVSQHVRLYNGLVGIIVGIDGTSCAIKLGPKEAPVFFRFEAILNAIPVEAVYDVIHKQVTTLPEMYKYYIPQQLELAERSRENV